MYSPESSLNDASEYKFNFTINKPKVHDTITNNEENAPMYSTILSEDDKNKNEFNISDLKKDLFKNDTGFKGLLARKRGTMVVSPGKNTN